MPPNPSNDMDKKERLAEREGFRCQNGASEVSKTIKLEPKVQPQRAKEPSTKNTLAEQGRKKYRKRARRLPKLNKATSMDFPSP